jgi:hypothetical protein
MCRLTGIVSIILVFQHMVCDFLIVREAHLGRRQRAHRAARHKAHRSAAEEGDCGGRQHEVRVGAPHRGVARRSVAHDQYFAASRPCLGRCEYK